MASLSFRNETSSSFEVRVNDMSTSWGYKWIYWELFSPGLEEWFCIGDWTEYDIAEGEDTSDWLYVDGLDPDAEYEVRATITYSEAYWDDVVVDSVSTLPEEEILEWEFADRRDLGMRIDEYHSNITLSEAGVVRYEISF